jgi:hypothetical protein
MADHGQTRAVLEFTEARPAATEPIQVPLVEEAPAAIVAATQVPALRQPPDEPSGGANATNVDARRANQRGRTPPEVSYRAGRARKEEAESRTIGADHKFDRRLDFIGTADVADGAKGGAAPAAGNFRERAAVRKTFLQQ